MNYLVLFLFLILNTGISFWNAYASGAYLTESKIIGGWTRFMVWCGLVMAACGFTWVYLTLLTMLAVGMHWITPTWGETMFKLGYLIILLPILGSGMAIWIDSLVKAYRERSFGSVAIAGWNTYAQVSNMWDAASTAPGFIDDVMKSFSKHDSDDDDAMGIIVILLVIVALAAGAITTGIIARWADRRVAIDVTGRGNNPGVGRQPRYT